MWRVREGGARACVPTAHRSRKRGALFRECADKLGATPRTRSTRPTASPSIPSTTSAHTLLEPTHNTANMLAYAVHDPLAAFFDFDVVERHEPAACRGGRARGRNCGHGRGRCGPHASTRRAHAFTPRIGRVDVRPDPHAAGGHVLRVELPGFTKEETAVEVREDLLTITAEHGLADEAKGGEKATDKGKQKAEADDAYVQVDAQAKNDNADEDHAMDEHQDADADEDAELPSPHVRVQRSWTLPEGIDASAIKAEQEHGVLTVTIPAPKAKEEPAPVRVPIA